LSLNLNQAFPFPTIKNGGGSAMAAHGKASPRLFIFAAVLCAALLSCRPLTDTDTDLRGSAEIVNSYEYSYDETTNKYTACVANVRITNTGSDKIASSVISLYFRTGARTYYRTESSSTPISPGGSVFLTITNLYADKAEKLILGGIGISNQSYY
jgi:hypothetical protein